MSLPVIEQLVADVELWLSSEVQQDRAHAMDILTHALELGHVEGAMESWRIALYRHELTDVSKNAIRRLISYSYSEHKKGNIHAATNICDCLGFIQAAIDCLSTNIEGKSSYN